MKTRKEEILGAVARGWCSKKTENKTMDVDLAEAITDEIMLLPCFAELNIEQELARLYDGCFGAREKLDVLVALHEIRLQLREGEGSIK